MRFFSRIPGRFAARRGYFFQVSTGIYTPQEHDTFFSFGMGSDKIVRLHEIATAETQHVATIYDVELWDSGRFTARRVVPMVISICMLCFATWTNVTYYDSYVAPAIDDARQLHQQYTSGIHALQHVDECAWLSPSVPLTVQWLSRWGGVATEVNALWKLAHCADAITSPTGPGSSTAMDHWTLVARRPADDAPAASAMVEATPTWMPSSVYVSDEMSDLRGGAVTSSWRLPDRSWVYVSSSPVPKHEDWHAETGPMTRYLSDLRRNLTQSVPPTAGGVGHDWTVAEIEPEVGDGGGDAWWRRWWRWREDQTGYGANRAPRHLHPADAQIWAWRRYWVHQKRRLEDLLIQKRRFLEDFLDRVQVVVQNVRSSVSIVQWLIWWNGALSVVNRVLCRAAVYMLTWRPRAQKFT